MHKHNEKLVLSSHTGEILRPDFVPEQRLLFYFPGKTHKDVCWHSWVCTHTHTQTLLMAQPTMVFTQKVRADTHTHTQIVTWSHTAETTLAITQTLAFVPTVSVCFAGPRTRPPPLLSQKSLRTRPCGDNTQTHTHRDTLSTLSQQLFLCLLPFHSWPLVEKKKKKLKAVI